MCSSKTMYGDFWMFGQRLFNELKEHTVFMPGSFEYPDEYGEICGLWAHITSTVSKDQWVRLNDKGERIEIFIGSNKRQQCIDLDFKTIYRDPDMMRILAENICQMSIK